MKRHRRQREDTEERVERLSKDIWSFDPNHPRTQLPDLIMQAVRFFTQHCPNCGDCVQDKRYKGRCQGPPLFNHKYTETGITRECKCGFRFYFTWRNLVRVIKKRREIEKEPIMIEWCDTWMTAIERWFDLNSKENLAKVAAFKERMKRSKN